MPLSINSYGMLVTYGKEHKLWKDGKGCLELLGYTYNEVRREIERKPNFRNEVVTKIRDLLTTKNIDCTTPEHDKPVPDNFRGLYFMGMRLQLWTNYEECGKEIGITGGSVSRYVDGNENAGAARAEKFATHAFEAIKTKVIAARKRQKSEPDPEKRLSSKIAAPSSLTESTGRKNDPQFVTSIVEEVLRQQRGVKSSDWKDQLVAGELEISQDKTPGLRFLLPSKLVPDVPTLTAKEIGDTKELAEKLGKHLALVKVLIEELRRRMIIECQSLDARKQAVGPLLPAAKRLLGEAAALALTLQALQEVDLDGNLQEYLQLFERHFKQLFPPKLP